nr:reverse transcriptase domain-containing protein [Tanacetum cinerariifolium]
MITWIIVDALYIVTQVTKNVNNANGRNGGNGGNGGNNGCTYKGFMACNPKEYDGKGGAISLTRWIKKMENVIDNSGCAKNQKVKYAANSFVNKDLTWRNTQVQARGREAAIGMSWADFKALLVEELYRFHELAKLVPHLVTPESSRIKRAGILTNEAVSCGTLTKGNEKRKGVEESSKQGGGRNENKRAKLSHGSFDVIVGMDWLFEHKDEIVCHEKVVRIPMESGEILIVQGEHTSGIAKALSNVKVDAPELSNI